jgi:hypothetical protein
VLVDGVSVGAVGSYTFVNVSAAHTISASFAADVAGTFTITPSAGANGSISPATVQTVAAGSSATFTVTPAPGYHIESLSVDGAVIPKVSSYTFTNVQAEHTISASFSNDPEHPLATHISLRSDSYSIRRGRTVRLSSVLTNSLPGLFFGVPVRYEVRRPGSSTWRLLQTRTVGLSGASNTTRVMLAVRGAYRFRVRFLGTDDFRASTSRTIKVVVR